MCLVLKLKVSIDLIMKHYEEKEKVLQSKDCFITSKSRTTLSNSSVTIEDLARHRPEQVGPRAFPLYSHSTTLCRTSLQTMISSLIRNK